MACATPPTGHVQGLNHELGDLDNLVPVLPCAGRLSAAQAPSQTRPSKPPRAALLSAGLTSRTTINHGVVEGISAYRPSTYQKFVRGTLVPATGRAMPCEVGPGTRVPRKPRPSSFSPRLGVAPSPNLQYTKGTTTTTPYAHTPPTPPPPAKPSPSSVTATTVPASAGNPPTRIVNSDSWAGYGVEGTAPYTGVRGVFNVLMLTTENSATDLTDVWVGIDGIGGTARRPTSLIQIGVMEYHGALPGLAPYDQSAFTGTNFWVCHWT